MECKNRIHWHRGLWFQSHEVTHNLCSPLCFFSTPKRAIVHSFGQLYNVKQITKNSAMFLSNSKENRKTLNGLIRNGVKWFQCGAMSNTSRRACFSSWLFYQAIHAKKYNFLHCLLWNSSAIARPSHTLTPHCRIHEPIDRNSIGRLEVGNITIRLFNG